jgi:hypothetical protein
MLNDESFRILLITSLSHSPDIEDMIAGIHLKYAFIIIYITNNWYLRIYKLLFQR